MNELTPQEQRRLTELEIIIIKSWTTGGEALLEIKDKKLYRKDYGTFDDYCEEKWGKTGRSVRYLIESTIAAKELTEKSGKAFPVSQVAARAYSSVPQELKVPVAEHIAHAHKPVTAKAIKEAEVVVRKKEKVLDSVGRIIPDHLVSRWLRQSEFTDMMHEVSKIKCRLVKFKEDRDEIWRKVSDTGFERAGQLHSAIAVAVPYAVCTKCDGWFERLQNGVCLPCNSTGFMSKQQYDLTIEETKRIIKNDSLSRLPNSVPRQHPR